MSWRDNLRDASFRGAKFKVLDSTTEVGRRNVLHEYPFKDDPYVEDLGASADRFTIVGYIVQNADNGFDYFADRDKLISAIKQKGLGTLIHPFYGNINVSISGMASFTESFLKGGIARFSIPFVQTGISIFPSEVEDSKTAMDKIADKVTDIVGDNFVENYKYIQSKAVTMGNDLRKMVSMTKNTILGVRSSITSTVSKSIQYVNTIRNDINSILNAPSSIATFIDNSISSVLYLVGIPDPVIGGIVGTWSGEYRGEVTSLPGDIVPMDLAISTVKSLVELSRFGESTTTTDPSSYDGQLEDITITNKNTAYESLNREITKNMARILAITNATKVAVRAEYDSYNSAMEVMNYVTERIDEILIEKGDIAGDETYADYDISMSMDDMYIALEKLRAMFIKIMKQIGANLAKVINYQVPAAVIPSVVLAYQKYNDINRDSEINDRNAGLITNPGFLPQGRTIELLNV